MAIQVRIGGCCVLFVCLLPFGLLGQDGSLPPMTPYPVDLDGDWISSVGDRIAFQLWVEGGGEEAAALKNAVPRTGPEGAILDVSAGFTESYAGQSGLASEASSDSGDEGGQIDMQGNGVDTKITILNTGVIGSQPAIREIRLWRGWFWPPGCEEPENALLWTRGDYVDSSWELVGQTPIGYPNQPYNLSDMLGEYTTFYVRIKFTLAQAAGFDEDIFSSLDVDLGVDDGFVAYINDIWDDTHEIRRLNTPVDPIEYEYGDGLAIPYNATARAENSYGARVSGYANLLNGSPMAGSPMLDPDTEHVLSIQVLNFNINSNDCVLSPRIHARKRGPFLARALVDTTQSPSGHLPTAYEVVVRARSGLSSNDLQVDYFLNGDEQTLRTSNEVFPDWEALEPFTDFTMYRIKIPGKNGGAVNPALPIGTTVTYRVYLGGLRFEDDDLSFVTPGQFVDSFSFMAFGNGGLPTSSQSSLANVLSAQSAAFYISAGDSVIRNNRYNTTTPPESMETDLVEPSFNNQAVDHRFYNPYAQAMAKAPFYTAAGDEDLETSTFREDPVEFATDYETAYTMPEGPLFAADETYYSFDHGSAHIVVLKSAVTQLPEPLDRNNGQALGEAQIDFLLADLAETKKFWKIVVVHHPPFTSKETNLDLEVGDQVPDDLQFRRLLEQDFGGFEDLGVDLVISAHEKFFEETKAITCDADGNATIVQDGPHFVFDTQHPSAPVYIVTGGAGETLWECYPGTTGCFEPALEAFTLTMKKQAHVTKITVSDNKLTIQPLSAAGNPIDIDPNTAPGATSSTITKNIFRQFIRADSNQDESVNLSDGVFTQSWLFTGGPSPHCLDSADADGNGVVNITDSIYTFQFLFLGGPPPPMPFPACGDDPTSDALSCLEYYPGCE